MFPFIFKLNDMISMWSNTGAIFYINNKEVFDKIFMHDHILLVNIFQHKFHVRYSTNRERITTRVRTETF